MRRAARIGHGISGTASKLQKLAQLAKRTSVFDDPAEEINELTSLIKQDIQALNQAISELQQFSSSQQVSANRQSADHSRSVVDSLRARLKDATKDFKDVLTNRTQSLKQHQERRQLFSTKTTTAASGLLPGDGEGGLLLARGPAAAANQAALEQEAAGRLPNGFSPAAGPLLQQQGMMQAQDTYLSSRNEAIRNVESTIVELGGIFQQLAHMVQEQGELALRIDENLDDTLTNVENAQVGAQRELGTSEEAPTLTRPPPSAFAQMNLMKYLNSLNSNRWLIMKVVMVLAIFLVIFTVFLA